MRRIEGEEGGARSDDVREELAHTEFFDGQVVGGALQEGESVLLRSLHQRLLIRRRRSIDELCFQRTNQR